MQAWTQLSEIARKQTGRKVVGTGGGLYTFSDMELCVPLGSVEGLVHDLCHWVVANDEERKRPNLGLSQDWTHPNFDRMVWCEEAAWSLELYLFGDPTPEAMRSLMTPEAVSSGGGSYSSYYTPPPPPKPPSLKKSADAVADEVTEAALAEMNRARERVIGHGELRPDGNEQLRREACRKAEQAGLPVWEIQRIVRAWWLDQYPDPEPDADPNELKSAWDLVRKR